MLMVCPITVPDEEFPFEEPQVSSGLFRQPSADYSAAFRRAASKKRNSRLQAAPGSSTAPNPGWCFQRLGSLVHRKMLMKHRLWYNSRPTITETRHLTINNPFGLTLHSSLWNNNAGKIKQLLPGSQTLPAVLCPWGRISPVRLEVTSSARSPGFLELVLMLDYKPNPRIDSAIIEQYALAYMLLLKWYLHISCQARSEPSAGMNLYAAVEYQRNRQLGCRVDKTYSWVDIPADLKTLHKTLANAEDSLWLEWQKTAETAYSTSDISKANTFEEAKTAIYKAADSSTMSGIKREHALLLLHEIWERRGSFLDRPEIEKEYDRLITDYILGDAVSILENFFEIEEMPEMMLEWAVVNPFGIKRKDTEQLYELMWRAWRGRSAGLEKEKKKVLFIYQVVHARKMYREHLAELKLCGKGVDELKEFVCKNEARFMLSEELRLQLALDEHEKQLKTPTLVESQKEEGNEAEASQNDKQEGISVQEHIDAPDEVTAPEKQPE
ncbi:hypothetical protein B0T20DRAFT_425839 [Sordaria brevicollis]|uniref:Uncharacterized protein n=1 Tax=Sordaria brevicollis TaxID=83679 RepID=A0AAE0NVY0_SORBR|nr:hypothetical protein B0T20DRAFT_425839 [Sordaria brevicollis]